MDSTDHHQSTGQASSTPLADQSLPPRPLSDMVPKHISSESSSRSLELELRSYSGALLPSTSTAFWKGQIDQLSKPERETFLEYGAGDVAERVKRFEQICREQVHQSRAAKIARLMKPLFDTMNMYAPIAQTMIQADPTSSALVLGSITCIMSISSRFLDHQDKIVSVLAKMGEKLEILHRYGSDIYTNNNEVQNSLMVVFGDILQFCREAWKMFRDENGKPKSSINFLTTSLVKSFEMKFGDILSKFDKDLEAFNEKALFWDRKNTIDFQGLSARFMEHQRVENQKNFSEIISIGKGLYETVTRGQSEEAQSQMQRQIEGAQVNKEMEYVVRENKRQRVLAWLPSIAFHRDQEETSQKLLQGTGQWLLDNYRFQLWRTNPDSELLWVFGKRGCGKSCLASQVIQEFSTACERTSNDGDSQTVSAFIYCNSLESTKVDPSKLLGSILKQLCHQLPKPEIEPGLEQLYDRRSEARQLGQREIKDRIVSILSRFPRTFLVIDGLDECHELGDDQFEDLCLFLRSLTRPRTDNSVVKVVAFSRPEYVEIKSAFSGCSFIEIDAGLNNEDIKQFIAIKLSGKGFYLEKIPLLLAEVEGNLLTRADGMFLWVDRVVGAFKGQRTARDIRATMHELPRDLDAVYENSLRKILGKEENVRNLMMRMLLWITNAKRLLRRDELLEALVIEPGMKDLKQDDRLLSDDNFASDCADLIILDSKGYYQLLHSSLKDYLCSPPTVKFNVPAEYRAMQTNAEKTLSETCLTYLTFDKFKSGAAKSFKELSELMDENPFLDYAANFWGQHIAADNEVEVNDLITQFLYSNGAQNLSIQVFLLRHDPPFQECSGTSTPLHALSIFNLLKIAKLMPEVQSMKTQRDGYRCLALDYAVQFQAREICDWLLEKPDNISIPEDFPVGRYPAIHGAALNDWGQVVEALIAWKFDPERIYGDRQATPLHFAAKKGSESAFEALIKAKVAINVRDIHGKTPLIDATGANHQKLAMRLLEEGAEVNLHDINGFTALHWAAKTGDISVAKALIQKGADKEFAVEELETPIYVAARENCPGVLELLVAEHVDIEKKGPDGYTPLIISSARGSLKCVISLLRAGAGITACTRSMRTAFHVAAGNGHLDVLKTLYKNLPKELCDFINSVDNQGDTPLHDAVANGNKAEAKFLLEKGALVNKSNKFGQSPFYYAALHGHDDFIPLLLEADADPELRDNLSWTPLHIATLRNNICFAKNLLKRIPNLDLGAALESGVTPLYLAAGQGLLEFLNFFLEQNQDPEVGTRYGYTALHAAVDSGNPIIVRKLLDAGCDGLYRSEKGVTPFFLAVLSGKVKVVNVFLEKGVNGCDIPDKKGFTPFHAIASSGSLKMLERLKPFLDLESIKQVDCVGWDAMVYAAEGGHVEMIDQLISLGIPAEGLKLAYYRPIHLALYGGHSDFVHRQIELGANVNECVGWQGMSPLHIATCYRRPLISGMLLKAGADPAKRDVFGLSCLDYAVRDPKVWGQMGRRGDTYEAIDFSNRMPVLRKTVQRAIQEIIALPEKPAPRDDFERLKNIAVLAPALVDIGTESDVNAARNCCIEAAFPSDFALVTMGWKCDICAGSNHGRAHEKWYLCRQCYDQRLCTSCYLDYMGGNEQPKSAPKSLLVLRELENEMKSIREVFKDLTDFGSRFLGAACRLVKSNAAWLYEKAKQYDDWEKLYNSSGRFDSYQRPGQKFLKLIQKVRRAEEREMEEREEREKGKWKGYTNQREEKNTKGKDKEEADGNDTFAEITEELSDLYVAHRPDTEIPNFICSDHEYLEIPNQSAISETEKKCFGADGKLTNEWFSKLLENYQDHRTDGHADMQTSQNHEWPGKPETFSEESVETSRQGEGEDGKHTKIAEQDILGLSIVPIEPTETNYAIGDTQGETSDHESKAEADSSNEDLIDFNKTEKAMKLAVIKRALKEEFSDMVTIILATRVADIDEIRGEGDISDEDSQSIIPKQNDRKRDTELDEQAVPLENSKEPDSANEREEAFLLKLEVAWRLTQVIIVGHADHSLVRELIRDFLEGLFAADLDELNLSLLKGSLADIDSLAIPANFDMLKSHSPDILKELLIDTTFGLFSPKFIRYCTGSGKLASLTRL